jgi:glycosyltransferase involved in cell wall biosynthesis
MVLQIPWERELGGARVQLELAEAMAVAGHTVEHFCETDAFPRSPRTRLGHLARPPFSGHAEKFIRENAGRYDVIDAVEGCITVSKASLGFDGLLVARSVGLGHLFEQALQRSQREFWAGRSTGKPIVRQLRDWRMSQHLRHCRLSLMHADLVNVCNRDEVAFIAENFGVPTERSLHLPFGLHGERKAAFTVARETAVSTVPEVVFIGYFDRRKGAFEWPTIVRAVHERHAEVRFRFLGTGVPEADVRRELAYPRDARIEVRSRFPSAQLPTLLASSAIGVFPSHVEGFPFAVLEMLAAGLPVVAYDAPGARETIPNLDPTLLTPLGDPHAMASKVLALLGSAHERERLASRAVAIAGAYDWSDIAAQTVSEYAARRLRSSTGALTM